MSADLLRRDGHLSDLTLERVLLDELVGDDRQFAAAHIERCEVCALALANARQFEARVSLSPPPNVVPFRPPQRARMVGWGVGGALALAASLLLIGRVTDPGIGDDTFRVKGGRFDFEVFVHDGEQSRRVIGGDRVEPGDRIGFRVRTARPGFLVIAGIDASNEPYLCFPQDRAGKAERLEPSPDVEALGQAVRLDDVQGTEQLVAWLCDEPFGYPQLAEALSRGERDAPAGCAVRSVELVKGAAP